MENKPNIMENKPDTMENKSDTMENEPDIYVDCPHCGFIVKIIKKNCGIFRHGMYKKNNKQIDPHAPKKLCDKLIRKNLIYGCGKPFRLVIIDDKYQAEICEYI